MKGNSGSLSGESKTVSRSVERQLDRWLDVIVEQRLPFLYVVVAKEVKRF